MSTQLTNNTLTLNNINYTGGTAGVILTTPTTSHSMSGKKNTTLPAVSIGSFTGYNGSVSTGDNQKFYVRLPSTGRFFVIKVSQVITLSLSSDSFTILAGGSVLFSETSSNGTTKGIGMYIRVS